MEELANYVAALLNIKTDSRLVLLDIVDELQGIEDFADYRRYLRDNLDHYDTQYMSGFQKFVKLTQRYKREYVERKNAERFSKAETFAEKLAAKVAQARRFVLANPKLTYASFVLPGGDPYFTDFEQMQLAKIGTLKECVDLQRSVSGRDLLLEKLIQNAKDQIIRKAIGHKGGPGGERPDRKVAAMIGGAYRRAEDA